MVEAVVIVVVSLMVVGVGLRVHSWWRRYRVLRQIPVESLVRVERNVPMRILVQGTGVFPGMNPKRANRTRGDLALTADRFVITSRRGSLADLSPQSGRRFTSIRCTGPGRLIIEGDVPGPKGKTGLYRFEILVDDANAWVTALADFVQEGGQVVSFAR